MDPASSASSMQVSMDRGYSYKNLNLMQAKPKLFPVPLSNKGTKFMAKTLYASFGNPDRIL